MMRLPTEREGFADFNSRVAGLIKLKSTHIYMDTSFLMWLTKIGTTSRKELSGWLAAKCAGRVHVPVWSAHEYLRHHVAATITRDLNVQTRELRGTAGQSYAYLHPFMDSSLSSEFGNIEEFRITARTAFSELKKIVEIVRNWHRQYDTHAKEVISFINDHLTSKTEVFD